MTISKDDYQKKYLFHGVRLLICQKSDGNWRYFKETSEDYRNNEART